MKNLLSPLLAIGLWILLAVDVILVPVFVLAVIATVQAIKSAQHHKKWHRAQTSRFARTYLAFAAA